MSNIATSRPKLTDAQLVLLSTASQRDDSLLVLTNAHASAAKTVAVLLKKELVAELVVQCCDPHWRQDENGDPIGLKLTKAGYDAIGAEREDQDGVEAEPAAPAHEPIRAGTKQAAVINLLSRPAGATLSDLTEATGWLPHTTRAVLSGLRKKGFELSSEKADGAERRYALAAPKQASAA